jgi:ribosomal protein S18 acetylase RimI-like enzyme
MGAVLLNSVIGFAQGQNATRLWLQVNRGNTQAINAYRKYGFGWIEARVFDIGGSFVMDDDVMEMSL